MRFLFGLITGAIVTLLVATAMNAPTGQIVHQLVSFWQQSVARVSEAEPNTLPSPAADNQPAATAPPVMDAIEPTEPEAVHTAQANEPVATPLEEVEAVPDHTLIAASQAETALTEVAELVEEPALAEAPALAGQAVVWAPFHSEASAQGFASRLSQQLARPFHVKKQSAANYLVVYDYADEADRHALEQQIAYATGQGTP